MRQRPLFLLVFLALLPARAQAADRPNPILQDLFDRDITQRGITLIDWEGYMANPAIEVTILPPTAAAFPVQVAISAPEPRLYFDLPSTGSAQGPRKQLTIPSDAGAPFAVAIFPARDKQKKDSALSIQLTDARSRRWQITVPIHLTFTDRSRPASAASTTAPARGTASKPAPAKPDTYPVTVDFSQDKSGFYKDESRRKLFDQAVQDWAFYFAPIPLKEVPAHAEKTWIFEPSGFTKSNLITNDKPFTGYLLYTYGIDGPEDRSGGEPSGAGDLQQSDGKKLSIHRSGGMEVEIKGNHNKLGWDFSITDAQWFKATNLQDVKNDFYSVAHHETGHALIFNPNNPKFTRAATLQNEAIRAYLGADAQFDKTDHLDGIIDPASLHGGFGNEYHGKTPYGRWLITKLDLLVAQAIGYKLRDTDALVPLSVQTDSLPPATVRKSYSASLHAVGGIPFYDWSLSSGTLPQGLSLNRFTGDITGIPTTPGTIPLTISLRDYTKNAPPITRQLNLTIAPGP